MGTMRMYKAVRKAPLPAVVYWSPTCCKQEATATVMPMSTPLRISRFFPAFAAGMAVFRLR